jgi:redox-sensitive bicupin YhaK (pirin superfamily)
MHKPVKYTLPATKIDMDGFPVKQAIPTQKVANVDPFLLLHHARVKFSNRSKALHQGVGPHPHRGFSPVTFVIEGEVHHRDSFGNNQIAKAGEVQWMHAGAGIIHSERPSADLAERRGHQEIVQVWINSPAAQKMIPPTYQFYPSHQMTQWNSDEGKVNTKVVAGYYHGNVGKINPVSPLCVLWASATGQERQTYTFAETDNTMLYVVKGSVSVKGYGLVDPETLLVFEQVETAVSIDFQEGSQVILFSGTPINEKVVQQGPYVMNTETQILEAMRDYGMGKMGFLVEDDLK